jgi:predicted nuclease with TOPRIM domain
MCDDYDLAYGHAILVNACSIETLENKEAEIASLRAEVANLEYENCSLEVETGSLDLEVEMLYGEVDRLTNIVIECRRHALSGCSDRVVEITEEFADE